MARRNHRELATQRLEDILASAPDFVLKYRCGAVSHLARHVGMSVGNLHRYVVTERDLIQLLCLNHLDAVFEAVCSPVDWCGAPVQVLRAMSLALLRHADEKPSRHLVFLLHRQALLDPARDALETLLCYLTNNFQLAIQGVHPKKPFDSLHSGARMLLGEIMHVPLWWPEQPHIGKDEWLCHRIGQLADTAPPDWRLPAAIRADGYGVENNGWRDADPASRSQTSRA
jgi:AcrR family transcriptional regulator